MRSEAQRQADARYKARRTNKIVGFNKDTEADLLEAANSMPDFSRWVKNHLRLLLDSRREA